MAYNPQNANGQAAMAASSPVVIASNQSQLGVNTYPVTSGGVTASTGSSLGGVSAITITASPAQVYGWYFFNNNSVPAYIFFYNSASVTFGTTTPLYVLVVPSTGGANVFGIGIPHSDSIKIIISTNRATNTALTLAVDYNVFYK